MSDQRLPLTCRQCRSPLSHQARTCTQCGTPVIHDPAIEAIPVETPPGIYRLIKLLGIVTTACGGLAAMFAPAQGPAGTPVIPTILIVLGIGIYITGLLGSWWNTGD